ncbi:MAG: metal-sensitive transcriptional regulator [Actinobacteria bacterium]|nr:metal-sensitive transcriptional regulator [Actinomycetota bacterium]
MEPDTTAPDGFGYHDHKASITNRLRRIEGQVRGVERMVADDKYCIDILDQVTAVTKALRSVSLILLDEHLRHCVADAVRSGGTDADAKLAEASQAMSRLLRS